MGLVLALLVGLAVRAPTLWMPHFQADQAVNLGLAARIDQSSAYTLQHAEIVYHSLGSGLAIATFTTGERPRGAVINYYASGGTEYGQTTSTRMPLFPLLLVLSRRVWGPERMHVLVIDQREAAASKAPRLFRRQVFLRLAASSWADRWDLLRFQWYAAVLPLIASLLTIAGTFFLTRILGGSAYAATLAALILSTAPVEILCSYRVQADSLTTALTTWGAVLALCAARAQRPKSLWLACLAGLVFGLGCLAKQNAILVVAAYFLSEAYCLRGAEADTKREVLTRLGALFGVCLLVGGAWYLWRALNGHFYHSAFSLSGDVPAYSQFLGTRTWINYPIDLAYLSPLLLAGAIASPLLTLRGGERSTRNGLVFATTALVLFAVASWIFPVRVARYLLPLYPLLAATAALGLDDLRVRLQQRFTAVVAASLLLLPCAALLIRSYGIGRSAPLADLLFWNSAGVLSGYFGG